jgi:serine/threonine-protein kinase
MPLSPGNKLGPYEILAPIRAGGMGEVYRARDTRLGRTVAIKVGAAKFSERFEREARAVAALNHPNICALYDVGADYLVLEYVDGTPLCGPMPAENALKLAIQIAGALEEAHGKGVLHRDLKPSNILVTAKGTAKLLDFGLAKLAVDSDATQTMAGGLMGTPMYMAPEQAEGKPADRRSDVFSFGAVLYEMLAGRRAFGSLAAAVRDNPKELEAPAEVVRIVRRCLAKSPAERFQSMADLKAALERASAQPAERQLSIAVLPFANLSRDPDDEYFSDGLAEEIMNTLAHLPGLKVTARTSAFAFRGKEQDIRKIAEVLNVRTILEGSVRRSGRRIRVTAQLINAEDGYHLWSERYDREMADVFAMQDEIAAAIAGALEVKLVGRRPAPRYQPNLQAYEAFLKGRHEMAKSTPESSARAGPFLSRRLRWTRHIRNRMPSWDITISPRGSGACAASGKRCRRPARTRRRRWNFLPPTSGRTQCSAWWRACTITTGKRRGSSTGSPWPQSMYRSRFAPAVRSTIWSPWAACRRQSSKAKWHSNRTR